MKCLERRKNQHFFFVECKNGNKKKRGKKTYTVIFPVPRMRMGSVFGIGAGSGSSFSSCISS